MSLGVVGNYRVDSSVWVCYNVCTMGLIPQLMSNSVSDTSLGHIRPRHREMARMLALGMTQADVARYLGITQARLSIIVNSPLFKLELAKLEQKREESVADIKDTLLELAPSAVDTLAKTMYTSPSERLRLDAAKDILDRAGVEKKTSVTVTHDVKEHPVDLDKYRIKDCSSDEQKCDTIPAEWTEVKEGDKSDS